MNFEVIMARKKWVFVLFIRLSAALESLLEQSFNPSQDQEQTNIHCSKAVIKEKKGKRSISIKSTWPSQQCWVSGQQTTAFNGINVARE